KRFQLFIDGAEVMRSLGYNPFQIGGVLFYFGLNFSQRSFPPLAGGDVPRNFGYAHNLAMRVSNGGDSQRDGHGTTVFARTDRFIMFDALAAADALQNGRLFMESIAGNEHGD